MELTNYYQIAPAEIRQKHFDLIIAAAGYETRSIYLFQHTVLSATKKIAFAFYEKQSELNRKCNEGFFRSEGFEIILTSGESSDTITDVLKNEIPKFNKVTIDILVDYSCMTRIWYAGIIHHISVHSFFCKQLNVFFNYSPANYNLKNYNQSFSSAVSIIPHKTEVKNNLPLALIIGLGINYEKSVYLIKKLNPAHLILMYADPAFEKSYVDEVLRSNRKLLEKVEIRNLLNYPANNIELTTEILQNLCLILRNKFNVIIAPMGPKVFSLGSLLVNIKYPDVDIWRVQSKGGQKVCDRIPGMEPVILKTCFVHDEDE